jgi:hypothetical protein
MNLGHTCDTACDMSRKALEDEELPLPTYPQPRKQSDTGADACLRTARQTVFAILIASAFLSPI